MNHAISLAKATVSLGLVGGLMALDMPAKAAQPFWPMACRGPMPEITAIADRIIIFARAGARAGRPGGGECVWMDRAIGRRGEARPDGHVIIYLPIRGAPVLIVRHGRLSGYLQSDMRGQALLDANANGEVFRIQARRIGIGQYEARFPYAETRGATGAMPARPARREGTVAATPAPSFRDDDDAVMARPAPPMRDDEGGVTVIPAPVGGVRVKPAPEARGRARVRARPAPAVRSGGSVRVRPAPEARGRARVRARPAPAVRSGGSVRVRPAPEARGRARVRARPAPVVRSGGSVRVKPAPEARGRARVRARPAPADRDDLRRKLRERILDRLAPRR